MAFLAVVFFFAAVFFLAVFFLVGFFVAVFLLAVFFLVAFFAVVFFPVGFLVFDFFQAAVFFVVFDFFRAAVFFVVFRAPVFFGADLFEDPCPEARLRPGFDAFFATASLTLSTIAFAAASPGAFAELPLAALMGPGR